MTNAVTESLVLKTMTGTCAWCEKHKTVVRFAVYVVDGRYHASYLCKQCLDTLKWEIRKGIRCDAPVVTADSIDTLATDSTGAFRSARQRSGTDAKRTETHSENAQSPFGNRSESIQKHSESIQKQRRPTQ